MTQQLTYRGYHIRYNPPPIPTREYDWQWAHQNFDGSWDANDFRCGASASLEAAKVAIDEQIYSLTEEVESEHQEVIDAIAAHNSGEDE